MAKQDKKNFIRLDKVTHTNHYESIVSEEDLLAGQFVVLGDVINSAEGEEVEITKSVAGGEFDAIHVPVYLTDGTRSETDILFESAEKGRPTRALIPVKGDMISINAELAEGVEKGDDVAVATDGLGFAKATEGQVVVGRAIDVNYLNQVGKLIVIRFA